MSSLTLQQTRRWYSRIAPVYDLACRPLYAAPRRHALDTMKLRGGERVLEIGCGTGLNLPALAKGVGSQGRVLGLDATPAMLRHARTRIKRCGCSQVFLEDCNLLEPSLAAIQQILQQHLDTPQADVVLCSYVFAIAPRWQELFARAWQLLRPGGLFVLVDTRPCQGLWRFSNALVVPFANWSGCGEIRRPTWELLEEHGGSKLHSFLGGFVFVAVAQK